MGKIINIFKNKKFYIFLLTYITLLFFSWNLYYSITFNDFFINNIISSSSEMKNIYSWGPVLKENFFELSSNGNYIPFITIAIANIINIIGGNTLYLFFFNVFFPIISLFLVFLIFKRYLSSDWALLLSLLLVLVFKELPFREFLLSLFTNNFNLNGNSSPEIIFSPIPSFSTFSFLIIFYLSTLKRSIDIKKIYFFTIIWSVFIYIHPLDWLYGLAFWFAYFSIKYFRKEKNNINFIKKIIILITSNFILSIAIITPALISLIDYDSIQIARDSVADNISLSPYYIISYFLIPVFLLLVVKLSYKIDTYEIIINFWQVYLLMFIELIILFVLTYFNYEGLSDSLVKYRIVQFFLHGYYFVPPLHFITRDKFIVDTHNQLGINSFYIFVRNILDLIFTKYKNFIVYPIMFLIILQISLASYANFREKDLAYEKYYSQTSLLIKNIKNIVEKESFFIINSNVINILLLSDYSFKGKSLLVNRFSSNISDKEFYERVMIFSKHNGWSYTEFESFMLPGNIQTNINLNFFNESEFIESGLGYYLNFHDVLLNTDQLKTYRTMLHDLYKATDLQRLIAKYKVKYIINIDTKDNTIAFEKNYD